MDRSEQMNILTEKYLCAFLGFAVNRIGNIGEAEELSQEIAFRAVKAISEDRIKENFDAYMWSIAHNMNKINEELQIVLEPKFEKISAGIINIVKSSAPTHLSEHAEGYAKCIIQMYSEATFTEALYDAGFLVIPDFNENVPVACEVIP